MIVMDKNNLMMLLEKELLNDYIFLIRFMDGMKKVTPDTDYFRFSLIMAV
jgi:hypothetical protein